MAGAYGTIPAAIPTPTSLWQQTQAIPGMSGLTSSATGAIGNQLAGIIDPATSNMLKNSAAAWGVSSGMPGSGAATNFDLESLGLTSMGEQQKGLGNYMNFLGASGQQQMSPDLQSSIAQWNSTMAAAPDPEQSAKALEDLFKKYMNPAGGTGARGYSISGGSGGSGGARTTPTTGTAAAMPWDTYVPGSSAAKGALPQNIGNTGMADALAGYGAQDNPWLNPEGMSIGTPTYSGGSGDYSGGGSGGGVDQSLYSDYNQYMDSVGAF